MITRITKYYVISSEPNNSITKSHSLKIHFQRLKKCLLNNYMIATFPKKLAYDPMVDFFLQNNISLTEKQSIINSLNIDPVKVFF